MKTYCIDCKWAASSPTDGYHCKTKLKDSRWSWVVRRELGTRWSCEDRNATGDCKYYSPSLWVRFRAWVRNG